MSGKRRETRKKKEVMKKTERQVCDEDIGLVKIEGVKVQ